jgi:hypothetical protein
MTDLLERNDAGVMILDPEPVTGGVEPLSTAARALLAVLCGAAAAVHFAMVPAHAADWRLEGIGFMIAGWVQVLLVVMLVVRPTRRWLAVAIVANVAFIGVWAISRTVGLPAGPNSGIKEAVTSVDLTCVIAEALTVLAAVALLIRPRLGHGLGEAGLIMGSVLPIAVVAVTVGVLVSPTASNHTHAHRDAAGVATDGHVHGGPTATSDDLGLAALANGHQHSHAPDAVLDATAKAQLAAQLDKTRRLMDRYPTVADATAAGYHRAGPFTPGLGTHYMPPQISMNPSGVMDDAAMDGAYLIYDGIEPTSRLAGFMYLAYRQTEPEGFVGPNDHWHFHTNVCLTVSATGVLDTPLGADAEGVTKELCDTYGGTLIDNTGYMIHVWTVPGYESSQGVFSDVNPAITCPDGTYHHIGMEEIGTKLTTCLA